MVHAIATEITAAPDTDVGTPSLPNGSIDMRLIISSQRSRLRKSLNDPQTYLADVISRIVNGHPNSQIDDLLPWSYPTAPALRDIA
jgi:transposase